MSFEIDWAIPIVGRKFTVFALFYFVFEGNFQVKAPGEAYIGRGDLTDGFLRYRFGGLIFGGAYTLRGLFSEFYGISTKQRKELVSRDNHLTFCQRLYLEHYPIRAGSAQFLWRFPQICCLLLIVLR